MIEWKDGTQEDETSNNEYEVTSSFENKMNLLMCNIYTVLRAFISVNEH